MSKKHITSGQTTKSYTIFEDGVVNPSATTLSHEVLLFLPEGSFDLALDSFVLLLLMIDIELKELFVGGAIIQVLWYHTADISRRLNVIFLQ